VILKDVAKLLKMQSSERPKKAAQYSTGILRLMESLAKSNRTSLREWTCKTIEGDSRSPYQSAANVLQP